MKFFSENTDETIRRHRVMLAGLIILFFLLWVLVPLILPQTERVIYTVTLPLRFVGVFVHEMGHGLASLISGGSFYWFQMDMSGGLAVTAGGFSAIRLLGGLLAPALVGALLMIASIRLRHLDVLYFVLVTFFVVGIYYMIKPLFLSPTAVPALTSWSPAYLLGILIPAGAAVVTLYARTGTESVRRVYLQFLGVLLCYSAFSDTHYIFHYAPLAEGLFSDARVCASLFWPGGPEDVPLVVFGIVASLISLANFALLTWGAYRAFKPKQPAANA